MDAEGRGVVKGLGEELNLEVEKRAMDLERAPLFLGAGVDVADCLEVWDCSS